ncbi:bifunctional aspartate transaminase/aspartate 4-decarboxylase [Lactobacillus sp. PV037]|uniref:bifunctional aspartate transaminase/aspartate 4-decarboxylase n=1 Tax=unclassified Lactobacillus TaxID=2620435 RepID=UPI002240D493|nr:MULTISPECIES: bifunctional aspartate transaminase/aspartate 4-decarboxylase [unclassified Lactobacillus]QNQ82264.1 bifunctional aspartate transaminase/aspartate 4-decarboxylase [Lactobacillus sp. PV012]QNQ83625.1 bifunctional aspartate transaminase/aspartate 4-decarboxylase [Lactobacillus sp. PV037]
MDNISEKKIEQLGTFEISQKLLALAKNNEKGNIFLNAGRGNPNWIQTLARLAFARLVEFSVNESKNTINDGIMAGFINKEGIRERLFSYLDSNNSKVDKFIIDAINYCKENLKVDCDDLIYEWANGVIGNDYPVPSRCLKYNEIIVNEYLQSISYRGKKLANQTSIFPTEGATAAIAYAFHSLKENHLLKKGDKIAINEPIFPPYIMIPELNDYQLVEVDLASYEKNNWEIEPAEIEKLKDPALKALIVVDPTNPTSKEFNSKALHALKDVVKSNPELMIISDEVYGSFVPNFTSVYSVLPYNTMLVYSYSKLFGCTGWRLGAIALNDNNIFDAKIKKLPEAEKRELFNRYKSNVVDPNNMPFIDRLCSDSRSVGLYHTAGLSTPQQIMMSLFSLTHLVYAEGSTDAYIDSARKLVKIRYEDLHNAMNAPKDETDTNTHYYSLIDIYRLAEKKYGKGFRKYLEDDFNQIDFLLNLAKKNGVVLVDGVGFGAKPGELRVSEANLPTDDYTLIGEQVLELLGEYYKKYKENN